MSCTKGPAAAEGRVWVHPVKGAVRDAGRDSGCSEGLSRTGLTMRLPRGGLLLLSPHGSYGSYPGGLARPEGDERRAARDGLSLDDQRVAAVCVGIAVLRHTEE